MVNTFLPSPDFRESAKLLDYRRLGKQRVEAWQILQALLGRTIGWKNHPASKMWRGHERILCEYGIAVCDEWISRGYRDSLRPRFVELMATLPECEVPEWLGRHDFHRSHQSNLKRKDPEKYPFNVPGNLPYYWPVD